MTTPWRNAIHIAAAIGLAAGLVSAVGVLLASEGVIGQGDPLAEDPAVAAVIAVPPTEGIVLPAWSGPRVSPSGRPVDHGMSTWAFWSALVAQGATCGTQEYAYARFHVYGANVAQRLQSCALNVGPVIGMRLLSRWMSKRDADASVIPSIGWGVFGTAKNVRDIRTVDRLIRQAREGR